MPANKKPLIGPDGEVRPLEPSELKDFKPSDTVPELRRLRGRPPLRPEARKQRVTMYLDPDVVARLKEGGRGWQTRANEKLREVLGL